MGCVYRPAPLRQRVGGQREPLAHAGSRRTPLYRVCVSYQFPAVHISQTCGLEQNFVSHSPGPQKSKTKVAAGTQSSQGIWGRVLPCVSQPLVVAGVHSLRATGLQPLPPPLHGFSLCLLSYETLAIILRAGRNAGYLIPRCLPSSHLQSPFLSKATSTGSGWTCLGTSTSRHFRSSSAPHTGPTGSPAPAGHTSLAYSRRSISAHAVVAGMSASQGCHPGNWPRAWGAVAVQVLPGNGQTQMLWVCKAQSC